MEKYDQGKALGEVTLNEKGRAGVDGEDKLALLHPCDVPDKVVNSKYDCHLFHQRYFWTEGPVKVRK